MVLKERTKKHCSYQQAPLNGNKGFPEGKEGKFLISLISTLVLSSVKRIAAGLAMEKEGVNLAVELLPAVVGHAVKMAFREVVESFWSKMNVSSQAF